MAYYKKDHTYQIFMVVILILVLSVVSRLIVRKLNNHLPQTALSILIGIGLGLIWATYYGKSKNDWSEGKFIHIMDVYIPMFICSTMYRISYTNLIKYLPQLTLITLINGIVVPIIFAQIMNHSDLSHYCCLMRSIALVPIEPLHMVVMVKRLARFKHLEAILEIESVLLTIPVFFLYHTYIGIQAGIITQWYHVVTILLRKVLLGIVIGFSCGKIQAGLLVRFNNGSYYAVGVSICMTYITYFISAYIAFASAELTLICSTCIVLSKRHTFYPEVDADIGTAWTTIQYICETVALTLISMNVMLYLYFYFVLSMAYVTVFYYLVMMFLRLIVFVILSPILRKLSTPIDLKGILVLTWASIKGPISLNFINSIYTCKSVTDDDQFIFTFYMMVILSVVINGPTIKYLFHILGYLQFTMSQRMNMNIYVDMLNKKSEYMIHNLKYRRYYEGVYWNIIRDNIKLEYSIDNNNNLNHSPQSHFYQGKPCEDCETDVPYNVTEMELGELLRENETKIIKLKRIFIINKYLRGSIDKQSLQIIAFTLEKKLEFAQDRQTSIDIKEYFTPKKYEIFAKRILQYLNHPLHFTPPPCNKPRRQLAFYLTMHFAYDYIVSIITIANSLFILWNNKLCCLRWMGKYHLILYCFYVFDFMLKYYGLSYKIIIISATKQYFKKKSNWIDFFCLLMTPIVMLIGSEDALFGWVVLYIFPSLRLIAAIRLLVLSTFLSLLWAPLLNYLEYEQAKRTFFGYELAVALVHCDNEIIDILHEVVVRKAIRSVFRQEIIGNINSTEKILQEIDREQPHVRLTVNTKQVIQITLNVIKEKMQEIEQLKMVDQDDCDYIWIILNKHQKKLSRIRIVHSCQNQGILKSVPWITTDELFDYFLNNSKITAWNAGDMVQSKGKVTEGIYIIITGLLRLSCVAYEQVTRANGILPIIDKVNDFDFMKPHELLVSGDILGELSFVTGRPYDCNVIAETYCQAYWLTTDVLKRCCESHSNPVNGLECQIWKNACLKLAIGVLLKVPVYNNRTTSDIEKKLTTCFIPDLHCYKSFILTEKMSDVVLIDGVVESALTAEIYLAPMLIPRAVQRVMLPKDLSLFEELEIPTFVPPKLLIVPKDGLTEIEIMKEEEVIADFIPDATTKYVLTDLPKSFKVTSFSKVQVDNIESASMINFQWEMDKDIVHLDSSSVERRLERPTSEYDSIEWSVLPRNRLVKFGSSSDYIPVLETAAKSTKELK